MLVSHNFFYLVLCFAYNLIDLASFLSDVLRLVKDPEKDATLEELDVLQENRIKVCQINPSCSSGDECKSCKYMLILVNSNNQF